MGQVSGLNDLNKKLTKLRCDDFFVDENSIVHLGKDISEEPHLLDVKMILLDLINEYRRKKKFDCEKFNRFLQNIKGANVLDKIIEKRQSAYDSTIVIELVSSLFNQLVVLFSKE